MFPRALTTAVALGLAGALSLAAQQPEHRTPRAGEAVTATFLGKPLSVSARDRSRVTFLGAGAILVPGAPGGLAFGPQGGLYLWRADPQRPVRLRAIVAGIANEVRLDRALSGGASLVATLDSVTLPWARSEYVQGERRRAEELEWHQARAGVGAAVRRPLGPRQVDNGLDVALLVEGGGLWFARGSRTAPDFVPPSRAIEMRLHLRARADALERNLIELSHSGWAAGLDLVAARRSGWEPWGAPGALEAGGRSWRAASGYLAAAFGLPGFSERHRLLASLHAGAGGGLDRFSAFRLGGGSTWGDYETLSRAVLPGAGLDEIAASRYAIVDLEYRFELAFFLYLQLRGTLAWATGGSAGGPWGTSSYPAVSGGLTTGLPWGLGAELAVTYGFGLELVRDGRVEKGRTGFLLSLSREF